MDEHIMMKIMQCADPSTATKILVAGGAPYFEAAKALDILHNVDVSQTQAMSFDVVFTITDTVNENLIAQRIKEAFCINNNFGSYMISYDKTFAMAVKGWGKRYMIVAHNNMAFLEGLVYLHSLVSDGMVVLLDDVRLEMPNNNGTLTNTLSTLTLAGGIQVVVDKIMFNMFYLAFDSLVQKTLRMQS